jgi:ABC-type polysaccharide/polyol phosphate export permease
VKIMNLKTRHYIDLITVLTQKEIKVRYKNSYLGYLWSILHPLPLCLLVLVNNILGLIAAVLNLESLGIILK